MNIETIIREMDSLPLLYPEAGHNGQTLPHLAEQWADLLADEDVAEPEFVWAMRRAKKKCKFFPTIADILEGVTEYREHPPARVDAAHRLPQASVVPLSPEEIERNKQCIGILAEQAARKITAEEAATRMAKLGHPAFNGTYL